MNIKETMLLLMDDSKLDSIIETYQPCFTEIDQIVAELKEDRLTDERSLLRAQTRLTGLYGTIVTIFKMAEATKTNIEAMKFIALMEEDAATNPSKPATAAKLDRATSASVANWRVLRNVFEGYVMAAEKAIFTCQSNLKYVTKERMFNSENPERY